MEAKVETRVSTKKNLNISQSQFQDQKHSVTWRKTPYYIKDTLIHKGWYHTHKKLYLSKAIKKATGTYTNYTYIFCNVPKMTRNVWTLWFCIEKEISLQTRNI